jgi:hypothetical protein
LVLDSARRSEESIGSSSKTCCSYRPSGRLRTYPQQNLQVAPCFPLRASIINELLFQYKFAPDLIMLDAYETVESWMATKNLNPRKLIPAMMRYSSELHAK